MNHFKKLIILFFYFFRAKWILKLPKKNKFLLVDGQYNPFIKYLKKKDLTILYRRGEEINIPIFLKCLFKFKFSTISYCVEFIKYVSPKLILTAFDYHTIFYKLKIKTGIDTLMLQKGKRVKTEGIIKNSNYYFPKNSKKKFFVNYILVFTEAVTNFYKKRISGQFFEIGSFENNFNKPNIKTQKEEIIFISNYSEQTKWLKFKTENEDIVAHQLYLLAKKRGIKFKILPRFRKVPNLINEEISYYKKRINDKLDFVLDAKNSSYNILLKYKYIFATYSTIAQESLVKGNKVGFIMFKSKNNPAYKYRFGNFEGLKNQGLFWTSFNKLNSQEIKRVFNYVLNTKYNKWQIKTKYYRNKIMAFDYKNKTFKRIINKYI